LCRDGPPAPGQDGESQKISHSVKARDLESSFGA